MHDYQEVRKNHAKKVCQTIDGPILVFDYFQLGEVLVALIAVMTFGIVFNSWLLMLLSLVLILGVGPVLRRRNQKGFFLHWPYRYLGMSLPGIVQIKPGKPYSD